MEIRDHVRTTGTALKNWFVAQSLDALAVGIMWLVGLWIIGVPWAPLWAFLGAIFQFVPNIGAVISVVGPVIVGGLHGGWMSMVYVLILYAIIAILDGLWLQPYLMRRTSKVPIWASIIVPIVMGFIIPFWGILLAPPILAVFYAYKNQKDLQPQMNAEKR